MKTVVDWHFMTPPTGKYTKNNAVSKSPPTTARDLQSLIFDKMYRIIFGRKILFLLFHTVQIHDVLKIWGIIDEPKECR